MAYYLWDTKEKRETTKAAIIDGVLHRKHERLVRSPSGKYLRAVEYLDDSGEYKIVLNPDEKSAQEIIDAIIQSYAEADTINDFFSEKEETGYVQHPLMALPTMQETWVEEFVRAGFPTVEAVSNASVDQLDEIPVFGLATIRAQKLIDEATEAIQP